MRRRLVLFAAVLLAAAAGALGAHHAARRTTPMAHALDGGVLVFVGGGGNTTVLPCPDGVIVVDPKFLRPGRQVAEDLRRRGLAPVRAIVNTHYHAAHTRGNVNYPPDTTVVAHRRTRAHMLARDHRFWEFVPQANHLPGLLVDDAVDLRCGPEPVLVRHLGPGHTDGDLVVHLVDRGMLVTGDLVVPGRRPVVDTAAGGALGAWAETLDRLLAIDGVGTYVPGHGAPATRADVERFRRAVARLAAQTPADGSPAPQRPAARDGIDLDDWRNLTPAGLLAFATARDSEEW